MKCVRARSSVNRRSMFFISFVLVLLLGVAVVQVSTSYLKYEERMATITSLEEQIDDARLDGVELKNTLEQMDEKPFIIDMARSKFGLIFPGEKVVNNTEK